MSRFTDTLRIGGGYDRKDLAERWGLRGFQAIGKGVFTPRGESEIFLFVTREREDWMTPYINSLEEGLLLWDGEKGHGSDERIANASRNGEEIHLFYRERRHTPFTYHGRILLIRQAAHADKPSEFAFSVVAQVADIQDDTPAKIAEEQADYTVASEAALNSIDRKIVAKSRGIAQRVFRGNLLRLWQGSCAVTGVREHRVLRSSHIKPWADASPQEKVDHFNGLLLVPNLDTLFNEGLISFRDNGQILISEAWREDDRRRMQILPTLRLRKTHKESLPYLEYHRDSLFRKSG